MTKFFMILAFASLAIITLSIGVVIGGYVMLSWVMGG